MVLRTHLRDARTKKRDKGITCKTKLMRTKCPTSLRVQKLEEDIFELICQ